VPAPAWAAQPRLLRLGGPSAPLTAWIAPEKGGELAGLVLSSPGSPPRELLYRGRDYRDLPGWSGRAPILWPATGRSHLADAPAVADPDLGAWRWRDRVLQMRIHGFARDRLWRVQARNRDLARLVLVDDAATRLSYPFGFRLWATYRVRGLGLTLEHHVEAAGANDAAMPFSIGNHITFALPLVPGGDPGAVVVDTPARKRLTLDSRGQPDGRVVDQPWTATPLSALTPRTAIPLSGYSDAEARLSLWDPSGLEIEIVHQAERRPPDDPVLFNLWGDVAAGFFSPEPWVGKQGALVTGDGLIWLAPGQRWSWRIEVSVKPRGATT
jgi:galactose mutarotase-like enzyme